MYGKFLDRLEVYTTLVCLARLYHPLYSTWQCECNSRRNGGRILLVVAHWVRVQVALQHFLSPLPSADARKYFNSIYSICVSCTIAAEQMQREMECGKPTRIGAPLLLLASATAKASADECRHVGEMSPERRGWQGRWVKLVKGNKGVEEGEDPFSTHESALCAHAALGFGNV